MNEVYVGPNNSKCSVGIEETLLTQISRNFFLSIFIWIFLVVSRSPDIDPSHEPLKE